jgi:hypothetical protein
MLNLTIGDLYVVSKQQKWSTGDETSLLPWSFTSYCVVRLVHPKDKYNIKGVQWGHDLVWCMLAKLGQSGIWQERATEVLRQH